MSAASTRTTAAGAAAPRPRPATRRDVARAARVSLTTVTHALNAPPGARVGRETRERVARVARELGYRPSFVGRALVQGKTFTIGLLEPSYDSIFFSLYQSIVRGLARAMEPDDYHLLLLFRAGDHRALRAVTQGRLDGVFVLQSDFETEHIARLAEAALPTVVINRSLPPDLDRRAGCVNSDHRLLMQTAVAEFAARGCRTLLALVDHRTCDANRLMFQYFGEAVAQHRERGLVGVTLTPMGTGQDDFAVQLRAALAAGQRWDGILTDGAEVGERVAAIAGAFGLEPGRDYTLITTDIADGRTSASRVEATAYTMQPQQVGEQAWALMKGLLAGKPPRTVLVPYRRCAVRGAAPPAAAPGEEGGP